MRFSHNAFGRLMEVIGIMDRIDGHLSQVLFPRYLLLAVLLYSFPDLDEVQATRMLKQDWVYL